MLLVIINNLSIFLNQTTWNEQESSLSCSGTDRLETSIASYSTKHFFFHFLLNSSFSALSCFSLFLRKNLPIYSLYELQVFNKIVYDFFKTQALIFNTPPVSQQVLLKGMHRTWSEKFGEGACGWIPYRLNHWVQQMSFFGFYIAMSATPTPQDSLPVSRTEGSKSGFEPFRIWRFPWPLQIDMQNVRPNPNFIIHGTRIRNSSSLPLPHNTHCRPLWSRLSSTNFC